MLKKLGKILLIALLAIVVLVGAAYLCLMGRGGRYTEADGSYTHITANHSFNYIMDHPGLEGLGENVLPLGSELLQKLTGPWKLKIMIPFLGKHEETVVNGLNYAIDCAENGESEFISFYSDAEKAADPAREATGLLAYRTEEGAPFAIGVPTVLREGTDVAVFACGYMVGLALQAAELLKEELSVRVVNVSTIKPLNREKIIELTEGVCGVVTAEEHNVLGGLGSAIAEALAMNRLPIRFVGMQDEFGCSAHNYAELLAHYGLTKETIMDAVREIAAAAKKG